jgi:hypothetical protein
VCLLGGGTSAATLLYWLAAARPAGRRGGEAGV